jgi:glycosyltransferase involved in cell wall biosynthesis
MEGHASGLGLDGNVDFLGYRADAASILGAVDVVALPSRSEGLPVALLEALAMRRPVVASRVGGVPDLIRHGDSGLLVKPDDPEAVAREIVRLLTDPDLAARLGNSGHDHVAVNHAPERAARRMASVYRSVLSERD